MPPNVVINGRFLARRVTGVERYARELLSHLPTDCSIAKPSLASTGLRGHTWEQFVLPQKLGANSILWSPANTGPLMVSNQALTIHDLSPIEHPEWFQSTFAMWYRMFLPILVKRVRIVFTPSEYVRQKVTSRFGIRNVKVTPNGVDHCRFTLKAKQTKYNLPARYVLFVGSLEPRKNLPALLQAWGEVKSDFQDTWLVIAGASGRVFQPVNFSRTSDRVCFLDYVEEDSLPGLYAGASLLVLPSFEEGFGLSPLEAMACGTPVIVSNGGALPEVVGDAGLIFDLSKPDTLAESMKICLSDSNLQQSLKERGLARAKLYSWQNTAELVWNTLNEI
ncbi:MAG TPA: glycosyltransferase family 1 protein [Anaerolineales bacterium]|nr:glycosyltransferase family 1 protein [Anaerolineales bacterium]